MPSPAPDSDLATLPNLRQPQRRVAALLPGPSQVKWLLYLGLLPLTLAQVIFTQQPGPHPNLLFASLVVASLAWVGWLWVWPWRSETFGSSTRAAFLLAVIAFASGFATLVDGPGWSANLLGGAVLEAGASARWRTASAVLLSGGLGLATGGWLLGKVAIGIFGQLPTELYIVFYLFLCGCLLLTGVARGLRREQLAQARLLLSQRQDAIAARERAAALGERSRIAREIHDILAHSLADLAIQLELADALLTDSRDRSGALERVRHAHHLAADGLEETRRAIHALRSDAPPLPEALAAMVTAYHRSGSTVDLQVEGSPRPLAAATGLAMLRTAQEALANSHKHAAGQPVHVGLSYQPDRVALTVRAGSRMSASPESMKDGGPPPLVAVGGGYGLAGMRERLLLVGGTLAAGPGRDGWSVVAEVPG